MMSRSEQLITEIHIHAANTQTTHTKTVCLEGKGWCMCVGGVGACKRNDWDTWKVRALNEVFWIAPVL